MWFLPLDRNVWQKVYSVSGISIKYLTYMIYIIHCYYFICVCLCLCVHASLFVWRSEDNMWGWFLPSVVCVLVIELSLLGLAASSLTYCPRQPGTTWDKSVNWGTVQIRWACGHVCERLSWLSVDISKGSKPTLGGVMASIAKPEPMNEPASGVPL